MDPIDSSESVIQVTDETALIHEEIQELLEDEYLQPLFPTANFFSSSFLPEPVTSLGSRGDLVSKEEEKPDHSSGPPLQGSWFSQFGF